MAGFNTTQANFEDARNFVARVIALPVDGDGYIGMHNTYKPKAARQGKSKLPFGQGMIAADPDDFVSKIPKLMTGNNRDIYVCMGTQKTYMESPNRKTGEIRFVPDRNRDNIDRLKSLYIDVDFKGGTQGYPSEQEAHDAIKKFAADTGLPEPNVWVHTGGGFHVYWVMDRPLPRDEWQILARELVEAIHQHGLKCDLACTSDATRILRVPRTFNYKYEPPRTVKVHTWTAGDYPVDDITKVLSKYAVSVTHGKVTHPDMEAFVGVKPFQGFTNAAEITELGDGCMEIAPVDLKLVYPECGFIRDTIATEGKNLTGDTLWNLTTLLSVFTTQGRGAAHLMARGNQYYNKDDTDKLFDRKVQERARGVGWPKCATLKAAGATQCATCPHFAKGGHPFNYLASPKQVAPDPSRTPLGSTESPVEWLSRTGADYLPEGYSRNKSQLIFKIGTDDDGNNFEIMPTRSSILSDAFYSDNPGVLYFKAIVSPFARPKTVAMPVRAILSQGVEMTNILGDAGITISSKKEMGEFLMAWVDRLKETRHTYTAFHPFGWAEEADGVVGFAYAGKLYTPDTVLVAKDADEELAKQYHPQGDIEQWKRAAKLVTNTKRPAMDAILASAFAAPLVYFTGEEGLYFGVYSEDSGIGKTTAMRIAQSVWSIPGAVQRLQDTSNSVQQKMGLLRHLPVAWDELKGEENLRDIAKLIFDLTSGRGKNRLTTDIKMRHSAEWRTLLCTASNNSIADYLNDLAKNNDAGFYRLFELHADPLTTGRVALADAGALKRLIDTNFGVAGQMYAQFLGKYHKKIYDIIESQQHKLQTEFEITQPERNWLNVAVVLIVGAQLANMLGLTEIDVPALKERLRQEIEGMRNMLASAPLKSDNREVVLATLTNFIRAFQHEVVITNDIWWPAGRPKVGAIQIVYPIQPPQRIVAQFSEKMRILRVSKTVLDDWLRRQKMQPTDFKKNLAKHFSVEFKQKQALGTGLPGLYGGQEAVIDFDCGLQDELGLFVVDTIKSPSSNVVQFQKP